MYTHIYIYIYIYVPLVPPWVVSIGGAARRKIAARVHCPRFFRFSREDKTSIPALGDHRLGTYETTLRHINNINIRVLEETWVGPDSLHGWHRNGLEHAGEQDVRHKGGVVHLLLCRGDCTALWPSYLRLPVQHVADVYFNVEVNSQRACKQLRIDISTLS